MWNRVRLDRHEKRDLFYGGEGKGSVDAVYDSAMADALSVVSGKHVVAGLADIRKVFRKNRSSRFGQQIRRC